MQQVDYWYVCKRQKTAQGSYCISHVQSGATMCQMDDIIQYAMSETEL